MDVHGQIRAPAALSPVNSADIHCIGGWVGCRAGLDDKDKRKSLLHLQGIEPRLLNRLARHYTD